MTSLNSPKKLIFKIKTNEKNILKMCNKESNNIMLNLLKNKIYLYSNNNKITVTFLPKRFDIIIKNGYAYFYLKEEK